MLKEKMLWMKDSGNIGDEIRQCRDEGRQIEALLPRAEKIAAMEDGEEKEKQARELLLEMENCPVEAMFPYEEPEACEDIRKAAQGSSLCRPVPEEELENRLKGAWIGRASGCLLGIPVEGWSRSKIHGFLKESGQYPLRSYMHSETDAEIREKYGVTDRDPGTAYDRQKICWINNMDTYPVDDDMNYTVLSLRVLERAGSGFTSEDVAESWLFGLPAFHTCTAERVAYRNLMHGVLPPESGRLANPFREWIGAQIRVDFYGYIAAGNPALAADMACRDAVVAQSKNGVYAAMYTAALIASAAVFPRPCEWVEEAMKQIPLKSRLYHELSLLLSQWRDGASWKALEEAIHGKYKEEDHFDWCLAIPNALIVTACVLCFGQDYSEAVIHAVLTGFDTDCNGATVGSIAGIACGADKIPDKWKTPVQQIICSSVNSYTRIPVEEIVKRTIAVSRTLRP